MFFWKDQHKEDDECVKDFWSGCCGSTIFASLGVLSWMYNVFIMKRGYLLDNGSFEDFGNKGILESVINHIHRFYPEFLSRLWKAPS